MSVAASVVQQSLRNQLQDRLKSGKDADEIVRKVRESLDAIKTLDPKVAEIVRQCYETATGAGFVLMTGIVAFALISACGLNAGGYSPDMWKADDSLVFIREKKLSK